MEKVDKKDKKFNDIVTSWNELSYNAAVVSAALEYSKSKENIMKKTENENVAITYGINTINKKVLENPQKYNNVEEEFKRLMNRYEDNLIELANYHDSTIVQSYVKVAEEEKKQIDMYSEIYELIKEENAAKEKADNSDDEIREKICNIEDELSKSELRLRRLKPTIKKKSEEKDKAIAVAMESVHQELQRNVKGPKVFTKATKFFLGKINPYKMIEKNVFSNVKNRIEGYESQKNIKKINEKYLSENIIETIKGVLNNKVTEED